MPNGELHCTIRSRNGLVLWCTLLIFLWVLFDIQLSSRAPGGYLENAATIDPLVLPATTAEATRRRPLYKVVKASSLVNTRVRRELNNQDELLTFHNCPTETVDTTTAIAGQDDASADLQRKISTTLATQLSAERFWLLQETCQHRWRHEPMVAVVYFSSLDEYTEYAETFLQKLTRASCGHVYLIFYVNDNDNQQHHQQQPYTTDKAKMTPPSYYPINLLRNLALEVVHTTHVLVYDVDFLPSTDLSMQIQEAWQVRMAARQAIESHYMREALVVPVLQMLSVNHHDENNIKRNNDDDAKNVDPRRLVKLVPSNFDQLLLCVKTGVCSIFDENKGLAHRSTQTDLWMHKDWYETRRPCKQPHHQQQQQHLQVVQDLHYVPCIDSAAYEPYLVLPWCPVPSTASSATTMDSENSNSDNKQTTSLQPSNTTKMPRIVPYYDERFVGYGWNKIQYIHHLRYLGFLMWILPQGFAVHVPHAVSASQQAFQAAGGGGGGDPSITRNDNNVFLRQSMRQVYDTFHRELEQKYGWNASSTIRTCSHWVNNFANLTSNEAFCRAYAW